MNFIQKIHSHLKGLSPFKKAVIGVSGGSDSIALTLILKALKYEIIIAHLNHGLRGKQSDADEAFVKEFAETHQFAFESKKMITPKKGNLEANARHIRYQFLTDIQKKHNADVIAVAHHRDDQIETIIMNIYRGTGLRGLSGMRMENGVITRPLLNVNKAEIVLFLEAKGQSYCNDISNRDTRLLRNAIRHHFIPMMNKIDHDFESQLLWVSRKAQRKQDALEKAAKAWIRINIRTQRFDRAAFQDCSSLLKAEIVTQLLGANDLYGKTIRRFIRFIEKGYTGKKMNIKEMQWVIEYNTIHMLSLTQQSIKHSTRRQINANPRLYVRFWQSGDRFHPEGMRGSKKLQDFFVDAKVPRHQRHRIPLIVNENDEILSIGNLRLSEKGRKIKEIQNMKHYD